MLKINQFITETNITNDKQNLRVKKQPEDFKENYQEDIERQKDTH